MKRKQSILRSSQILKAAFQLKKESNRAYSLRALSRDLKLSVSYVSGLLNGSKSISPQRIQVICRVLGMDHIMIQQYKHALAVEALESKQLKNEDLSATIKYKSSKRKAVFKYTETSHQFLKILENWYSLALLDLITCNNFNPDPLWCAHRLNISEQQVKSGFEKLSEIGLIEKVGNSWKKIDTRIRFPVNKSYPQVRSYHKMMIERAVNHLIEKVDQENFENRLISSVSFSGNLENLEKAKDHLMKAMYEVMEIMMEGNCTEVFQLNTQLFPLTIIKNSKN